MQFCEDMKDKYGFNDGEAMPGGVGEYREVYLRAINAFAEKHGSEQRLIAWNRPGMHNWCLVLEVTSEYFDSLKSDAERYTAGPTKYPAEMHLPNGRDVGLQRAITDAQDAELDQYVRVRVTVARIELKRLCRRIA
jgi:hypothetical protein